MNDPPRLRGRPRAVLPGGLRTPFQNAPARLSALDPAGLSSRAARQLRALIVACELAPGQPIAETSLSAALGISRTPLREALRRLAVEGLVVLRPNRGAIVAPLEPKATLALFEALAGIERLAAELAAVRSSIPALRRLSLLQKELVRQHAAGRLTPYFRANQRFHLMIVAIAANPVLVEVHATLFPRAERSRRFALEIRSRWDESVVEHQAILDALCARDPASSGALLAQHVVHTGETVARRLAMTCAA
jgi:DNA-binding GntR family transcriptional regulator